MQKRMTVQLKGECFAPPSAMNHKMHCAEQILAWTWDRQVNSARRATRHSGDGGECFAPFAENHLLCVVVYENMFLKASGSIFDADFEEKLKFSTLSFCFPDF